MASKNALARARQHFGATLGQLPAAVQTMARHAPAALEGYLALREYAHVEPPAGHLDPKTRELLFVALDVAAGHVEAAKAHAVSALKAGASVEAIAQACVITMMVSGIHTWSQHGYAVVEHAARLSGSAPNSPKTTSGTSRALPRGERPNAKSVGKRSKAAHPRSKQRRPARGA